VGAAGGQRLGGEVRAVDLRGGGPDMFLVGSLAIAADGISVFAVDIGLRTLFRIDRVSGDRSIVSDATHGTGPSIGNLTSSLALSADETKAYVVDFISGLLEVDLATGNCVEIAGPTIGSGPRIQSGAVFGSAPDRIFSIPFGGFGVLEIDFETGDRVVISH
jgi:hypothetical protein